MKNLNINADVRQSNREKEVFRTLRTNIQFSGVENRVIAITSCTPDDGKSTITFNLALALAEAGKKTLLLDADMRKSVLPTRLQLEGELQGLSHLLSGQLSVTDVLYGTNIKNFFIMPTGVFPSNPTELLGNGRFEKLLTALRNTFDYIIIDTPPLGNVIDAAVIASNADGSILVLAADNSGRVEAKSVVEQLKSANKNILGVVLNKVDIKKNGYYGRKYSGYYGKKYGYYGKKYSGYYGNDSTY